MSHTAIFSDLHLPNVKNEDYELFLSTLYKLSLDPRISELWLLGDIFDCLVGEHSFWIETHRDFWQFIETFTSSGRKVIFFEGNHDFAFRKIATKHGIQYFNDGRCHLFHGRRVFLSHGDEVDTDNEAYSRWRMFIKSSKVRKIYNAIPKKITQSFLIPFAESYSDKRKKTKNQEFVENEIQLYSAKFRDHAEQIIRERSYHAVFLGHSHIKDMSQFSSKSFYCNLGCWDIHEKPLAIWNPEEELLPSIMDARSMNDH